MVEYSDPFGIYFNMLKMRYSIYDESISSLGFLKKDDKVNVFINLETAWKYLSTVRDLEQKLLLNREFKVAMIADIINIAAHYKEFFKNNGLDTKVFLYTTDFTSETGSFKESSYNEDYRSYYLTKYNTNPKFVLLTDALVNDILPKVRTICDFIPDVYFISTKNIDSSLVPIIFGTEMKERQNFIISGDKYETQYSFMDHYTDHLFLRSYAAASVSCTLKEYIKAIFKTEPTDSELELYSNSSFYLLLLACEGDKYRAIDGIHGVSYKTLTKMIQESLNARMITMDTHSIELLSRIFTGDDKNYIEENFNCMNLENSYKLLQDGEKKEIISQMIDRSDLNGLLSINKKIFNEMNPLRLESLLR